jgi:hypothetical protein
MAEKGGILLRFRAGRVGSRVAAADGFRFRFRGPDPPNRGIIVINMRVSLALTSHWLL